MNRRIGESRAAACHDDRQVELLGGGESDGLRDGRAAQRRRAQRREVVLREARVVHKVDEHCGRAVQRVALLRLHGAQRVLCVEELRGHHHCVQARGHGEHDERVAERVVEGQRAADARRRARLHVSQSVICARVSVRMSTDTRSRVRMRI